MSADLANTMKPQPLYDPATANPAYHLRYSWSGWPSKKSFDCTPVDVLGGLSDAWEEDGLRLLEHRWSPDLIQLAFSAQPNVSPVFLASRAKGRLDHALRTSGFDMRLSRKLAVRSVGDNRTEDVQAYIESQVTKGRFADARFEQHLRQFTVINPQVDHSSSTASARGRYWYDLHAVPVVDERAPIGDEKQLATIRDWSFQIAKKKGYAISRLAVMPDHLHVALRGDVSESPVKIVFALQNNLAYALGQRRIWTDNFYVGTFSEYNMQAIHGRTSGETHTNLVHHPHKADGVTTGETEGR